MRVLPAARPQQIVPRRLLSAVLGAAILILLSALATQYVETRVSAQERCHFNPPEGVAPTEHALLRAQASAWPIGRQCTWLLENGNTVTVQTSWTITSLAVLATIACAVVALWSIGLLRRIKSRSLWAILSAAISAPLITWAILCTAALTFIYGSAIEQGGG